MHILGSSTAQTTISYIVLGLRWRQKFLERFKTCQRDSKGKIRLSKQSWDNFYLLWMDFIRRASFIETLNPKMWSSLKVLL